MNERIWELFRQANHPHPKHGGNDMFFPEEFAELIVQECVQTLRDNTPVLEEDITPEDWDKGYIRAMVDCEHHIKEHFGVDDGR